MNNRGTVIPNTGLVLLLTLVLLATSSAQAWAQSSSLFGNPARRRPLQLAEHSWIYQSPAEPVPFQVAAAGEVALEFTVTAGEGTHSAHYPIHAWATFEADGSEQTAHPILILETKLPRPPREVLPVAWRPFAVAPAGELALWQLPLHRDIEAVTLAPGTVPGGDEIETVTEVGVPAEALARERSQRLIRKRAVQPHGRHALVRRLGARHGFEAVVVGVEDVVPGPRCAPRRVPGGRTARWNAPRVDPTTSREPCHP